MNFFLAVPHVKTVQEYFSRDGLLEVLHDKIDSLDIREPCDIFKVDFAKERFTKD